MDLHPYKAGPIEPICLPGNVVGLWLSTTYYFRRVTSIESIINSDPLVHDFGALAAGGTSANVQINELEMPLNEFGQFRAYVIDDIAVTLRQPSATQRKGTKNRTSRMTRFSDLRDPCHHQTEFYVYEDEFAFLDCLSPTGYAITSSKIALYGFRYTVEPIVDQNNREMYVWPKEPPTWTRVPASAFAATSRRIA